MARWDTMRLASDAAPALYGVDASEAAIIAVGYGPVMLRSTDGGASFCEAPHGVTTPCSFHGIARTGRRSLAVVTSLEGVILRSDDDGATWATVGVPAPAGLAGVWSDGVTALAVGAGGCVLRSDDEARTWRRVPAETDAALHAVTGTAAGVVVVGAGGLVLRSDDGAKSFCAARSRIERSLYGVWGTGSVFFASGEEGTLLRSDDAGASFRALRDAKGRSWARWGDTPVPLAAIAGRSEREVIAVGTCGTVVRTRDGGARWTRDDTGSFGYFNAVSLPAKGRAIAVGEGGVIVRSAR